MMLYTRPVTTSGVYTIATNTQYSGGALLLGIAVAIKPYTTVTPKVSRRVVTEAISATAVITSGISNVSVVGVTPTQAVVGYTAPSTAACSTELSESATYLPVVHDVDGGLFTGASADSRATSIGTGTLNRMVVFGARLVDTSPADSNNYSRALQANTTHYFRITCGTATATGTFATSNIPFQVSYQDVPQVDVPGATKIPTLLNDRTQTIVDPHTGALIRRVSLPGDVPYIVGNGNTTGPNPYDGGFIRVCGETKVGPDNGYLCGFAQGDGGQSVLYYIIPSTGEARYLGRNAWGSSRLVPNPTDSKFYILEYGVDLVAATYDGDWLQANPGTVARFTYAPILTAVPTAIQTFNALFDPAGFYCGNPAAWVAATGIGDYIEMTCSRGSQDSYAWVAIVKISTGTVVAATRVDSNIQCRWCAVHEVFPMYDEPGVAITTHALIGNALGYGPYIVTYTGVGTLVTGSTTIAVSGEPACAV